MASERTSASDDIHRRVSDVVEAEGVSRAEAIRRVAEELGRTAAGTSSAFYAAAKRIRDQDEAGGGHRATSSASTTARRASRSGPRHHSQLFAEMLPLVEAGASPQQAARRFGQDEDVSAIAAGFEEWLRLGGLEGTEQGGSSQAELVVELDDARARIASLEAENRVLKSDLGRTRQTLARLRAIIDASED